MSNRMSAGEASQPDRLEMELRRLEDVQRRRLREVTDGFSPLSQAAVKPHPTDKKKTNVNLTNSKW